MNYTSWMALLFLFFYKFIYFFINCIDRCVYLVYICIYTHTQNKHNLHKVEAREMNVILDLILEFVFEGTMELATTRKIPLWGRIMFVIIVFLVFGSLIGAITMAAIDAWQCGNLPIAIVLSVIDIAVLVLVVYLIRKMYVINSEKSKQ